MNAIILAHGRAAETVARHLPNWQAAFDGLTFICPADDPLPGAFPIGASCYNGQGAIERLCFAVCMASRFPTCAILEYDALVFTDVLRKGNMSYSEEGFAAEIPNIVLCSEVFPNEDGPIFAADTYGHCPWIATGETWWKLLTAGSDAQHGFPDRWLSSAAKRANVALRGMEGAYSRDRAFDATAARMARLAGAPAIHGIKTEEQFAEVMS